MAADIFRDNLPEDLEHAAHEFLPIVEVLALQRVSQSVRERIVRSLSKYAWDVVHQADTDKEAHIWLKHVCEAKLNIRSIHVVRMFLVSCSPFGIIHNYCPSGLFSRGGGLEIFKKWPDISILTAFSFEREWEAYKNLKNHVSDGRWL